MSYTEFIEKNQGNPKGEDLVTMIKTWKEEEDFICGKLLKVSDFEGGNFETNCKQYLFETDEGLVSTVLGASVDKQINPQTAIGSILFVKYQGKIALDDGRHVNKFTIKDVTKAYEATLQRVGEAKKESSKQ